MKSVLGACSVNVKLDMSKDEKEQGSRVSGKNTELRVEL